MSRTVYSKEVPGREGNYNWPVCFDKTEGYVGINQEQDGGGQRILLSPRQVQALLRFVK